MHSDALQLLRQPGCRGFHASCSSSSNRLSDACDCASPPQARDRPPFRRTLQSSTHTTPTLRRSAASATGRPLPSAAPHAAHRRRPASLRMPVPKASGVPVARLRQRCSSARSAARRRTSQRQRRQAASGPRPLAALIITAGAMAAHGTAEPRFAHRRASEQWWPSWSSAGCMLRERWLQAWLRRPPCTLSLISLLLTKSSSVRRTRPLDGSSWLPQRPFSLRNRMRSKTGQSLRARQPAWARSLLARNQPEKDSALS